MIVQALLNWFSAALATMVGVLPDMPSDVSAQLATVPSLVSSIVASVSVLAPVVPFAAVSTCFTILGSGFVVGMVIFLAMKVLSYSTGGGGAL